MVIDQRDPFDEPGPTVVRRTKILEVGPALRTVGSGEKMRLVGATAFAQQESALVIFFGGAQADKKKAAARAAARHG